MGSSTHTDDEVVATTPDALRQQALRQLKKRRDLHSHAFEREIDRLQHRSGGRELGA